MIVTELRERRDSDRRPREMIAVLNCLAIGRRALDAIILVRIQAPQLRYPEGAGS